jgi:hypothetical protein
MKLWGDKLYLNHNTGIAKERKGRGERKWQNTKGNGGRQRHKKIIRNDMQFFSSTL